MNTWEKVVVAILVISVLLLFYKLFTGTFGPEK